MSVKTEQSTEQQVPPFMSPDIPNERPALPEDFGVGSAVVMITPSFRRTEQRAERNGTVTGKARVWITVELEGRGFPREVRFRLDDQSDGSGGHYAYRFRTPEQHAWYEAQNAAHAYLMSQRITVEMSSPWQDRKLELARSIWMHENARTKEEQA